jgi:FkbM family methyltransferase
VLATVAAHLAPNSSGDLDDVGGGRQHRRRLSRVARSEQPRPRTRLDRLIERRILAASVGSLERYVRLLSPKQTLTRSPGWTFDIPARRDDLGTFARRLIWQRHHDERIDRPVDVEWCAGLRINLWLGNDVSWCVFVGGMYEPNELAFLAAALEPGMAVIDIGANDGLFTLVAASRVGPHGRVLAVEPSSREFGRLKRNVELNQLGNIESFRLALYSHAGSGRLARAGFGHEGQNAVGDQIPNPQVPAAGSENVALETLDAFAAAQNLKRLDFLKLDAEGSEARILEGGFATLQRFKPVTLMEVAPAHLAAQGSTTDDLLGLITDVGYQAWVFDREGLPRRHRDGEGLSHNIIAAPAKWRPPSVP